MGFDQYHEPPEELSQPVRTFARMIQSLIEEAEAIGWYEQRIHVEKDREAKKVMKHAQQEEFIHFAMDLEFLLRKKEEWRTVVKNVLFKEGDIVENAEKAEDKAEAE
ncbi:ferritin family protein [Niabella hirudinis]|uniref:ferritin family protein n=1 Tax=Niabella hirudinis TaxID=1285929 RepID=UPI003EBFD5EC